MWRWDPVAGARRLTKEAGVHRCTTGGATVVWSSHTEANQTFTAQHADRPDVLIASYQADPVVKPNITWLSVGSRQIRAALLLPSWWRPGFGKLPVLMNPYGGPAVQRVTRTGDRSWQMCEAQWFAEQGFAVVMADGSGTPGRGPAWEKEVYGDSLSSVLADQVDTLQGTAECYPVLDLNRVAIRGWSFGGTLAAAAVLRRPDIFHAAISGAAPSDAALYETCYRERFLGKPQDNRDGYRRGSTINEAANLTRPLLLIHGIADGTSWSATPYECQTHSSRPGVPTSCSCSPARPT